MEQYHDVVKKLCHRAVNTRFEDLKPNEINGAKRSILDAVGVMLAGSSLGYKCLDVVKYVQDKGGKEESTLLGFGGKYPAAMAAMANASMAHTLDFDDASENQCHPTAASLPAAFALLETIPGATGKDLIRCVVIANDFCERFGWTSPATIQAGWLAPQIKGLFTAAFAAGLALDLDEEGMMRCLGMALTQACGSAQVLQEGGNDVREIYQAFAQRGGVFSAELTKLGVKGCLDSMEGKFGFFNNFLVGKTDLIDLTPMDVKEGDPFQCDVMCYKLYSSCRQTHPYVDAVREMMAEHEDVKAGNITKINVQVGGLGQMLCTPEESRMAPVNGNDARFSIPWTVAVTLVYGKPSLGNFTPDGLKDQQVIDTAHLVEWESNAELCAQKRNSSAIVTVTTKDGKVYTKRCDDAVGCAEKPMTDDDFISKFKDCCTYSVKPMGEAKSAELLDMLLNLEKVDDLAKLSALLN